MWEEFWDALDWIRLQMEKPWGGSFRVAFGKLLPIRERLALPGMARSTRFVGGDATLDRLGAADWKALKYHSEPCQRYVAAIEEVVGSGDNLGIIAVLELLTFVVLASAQSATWRNEMILYVTDNANVKSWLSTRRARNRYVRALLLLLQRLEAEFSFTVEGVYVRTYHNTLNDWLTREDQTQVEQAMARSGWEKLALVENWEELLRSAQRPSLRLPGEIGDSANLAAQLATSTSVPRSFEVPAQSGSFVGTLAQVKVAPTMLASFEVAWARGGGSVTSEDQAEWLTCSLSHDPRGAEISRLIEVLQGRRKNPPRGVMLDCPGDSHLQFPEELITELGNFMTAHYQTTHLGSFAARKRVVCWWGEAKPVEGEVETIRIRDVNACWLLPLKPFNQATNLLQPPEFVFTRDPNIVTTGDPWLPKPVGHLLEKSTGERHLVHSHRGPACGPRLRGHPLKVPGGTLLEDGSGNVRPLLPEED